MPDMFRALFLFALLTATFSQAQLYERDYQLPVTIEGELLDNPWAGGLNSCQVSSIDVNMDGMKDLFIFDRIGSRISIFINEDNTPGVIDYRYTREFNSVFPSNMRNWVLLRDMNCDGKEDICTNSGSGFRIFWNTSTTELSFAAVSTSAITAFYDWGASSNTSGVFSISPDMPAFEDYDNDGDIDIWSWNEFSSGEFFYKNMAVENGDCSTPSYVCRNRCYGVFGESSESFELFYGEGFECDFNVANPRADQPPAHRHTGGTTLALDLDQNGLKDLVIGDVTENSLAAIMMMESSNGQDSTFQVHYDFPATFGNTLPAIMTTFLAAYYVDVNNDGVRDLLISPNSITDAADRKSLMLYINNGQNDMPLFEKIQDDFLQEGMIDLGNCAYPVVHDIDQDGKKDLIIANRKYFELGNSFTSVLWYMRNVGTTASPAYELVDDNWLNIPSENWAGIYPSFGDLDGDGDSDLIIGDQEGMLHYYINEAGTGNPSVFVLQPSFVADSDGADLDVGQNATPQIFDVNDDGKNDLIIGELNGCVNYYENIGTNTNFLFQFVEDTIGDVVATSLLGIQGKSVPHMYRNSLGQIELLIGSESGEITHCANIEGNLLGDFTVQNEMFENINEGERSSVFLADITGDNQLDMFVGNIGGGLGYYRHLPVGVEEYINPDKVYVYPNPASELVRIDLPENAQLPVNISINDGTGRLAANYSMSNKADLIDISKLQSGLYFVTITSTGLMTTKKLVVK